mgnify:CR=1 FL=1
MDHIIECRELCFGYEQDKDILGDISFAIDKGELITLIGPNGAGKSTFLNCLCGLLKPRSGKIMLKGNDISGLSRRQISTVLAYVPQKTSVAFDYSVRDFAVMGRAAYHSMLESPGESDYEKTDAALRMLGIEELSDRPINTLSGGEQQKVCIARALIQEAELIILDEPTSALDYGNQMRVLRLVKELSQMGMAILVTSHNPDHALMLESKVAILEKSGPLEIGACADILTSEKLSRLYSTPLLTVYSPPFERSICLPVGL